MMKKIFLITFFPLIAFGQVLKLEKAKDLSLKEIKKFFKSEVIEIYNYNARNIEKYHAFPMNEIFDYRYGKNKWKEASWVKVSTKDEYTPLIEMYKFKERKAYLAYARADQKPFTSILSNRSKIEHLSPFYLIWIENYKKGAAVRRDHWPYQITGFSFQETPPKKLIPKAGSSQAVVWGYKNFIKQCIACHSIDGAGGVKGGELVTSGITASKSDLYLKKFISNPGKVKPGTKMTPFPRKIDLRKKRITDIVTYLRFMEKKSKLQSNDSKVKSLGKILNKAVK